MYVCRRDRQWRVYEGISFSNYLHHTHLSVKIQLEYMSMPSAPILLTTDIPLGIDVLWAEGYTISDVCIGFKESWVGNNYVVSKIFSSQPLQSVPTG